MTDAAGTPGAWSVLAEGIHVRQSRAFWMNSVVLLDSEHTVIVDPGVLPSELDDLARLVRQAEPERVTLVLTHAHWDHVLGRPWWPKARVVAHDRFLAELQGDLDYVRAESKRCAAEHGEAFAHTFTPFRVDEAVSGQRFLKLDPWRLVLRDAFGHSDSQLSIHLPELGLLIAADMLSDIEIPMLNGPIEVYRRTLEALEPLAAGGAFEALVPGHGSVALEPERISARIETDLAYLEALERGVAAARRRGLSLEAAQEELDALEYTGKHAGYSMRDAHRDNVKFAWAAPASPRR